MIKVKSGGKTLEYDCWKFPAGEIGLKLKGEPQSPIVSIQWDFEDTSEIFKLSLLVDAIRGSWGISEVHLCMPYFPFTRQDRRMENGDSFSLQVFCGMLKAMEFKQITTYDVHSDVVLGMFGPGLIRHIPQWDLFKSLEYDMSRVCFVAPDSGACKKIYKLAQKYKAPVLECGKIRDVTDGRIIGCRIFDGNDLAHKYQELVVVDDICDGGASFLALADEFEKVRKDTKEYLHLHVTHGIFSKGRKVLEDRFKTVVSVFEIKKGI